MRHTFLYPDSIDLEDNLPLKRNGKPAALARKDLTVSDDMPIWVEGIDILPAQEVLGKVLSNVGARPWDRDAVDERIVQSVRDGSGQIIHSQEDVGGYPMVPMTHRALEVPETDVETWLGSFIQDAEN